MKRVLWTIILVAALAALLVAAQRWMVERPNRTVELVYDFVGLQQLSQESGVPLERLLADLKGAEVGTIAIQPESLGERILAGGAIPEDVRAELPEEVGDLGRFLTLPLAFHGEQFQLVQEAGLQAAPKLNTVPWDVEPVWLAAQPQLLILSGQGTMAQDQLQGSPAVLALVEFSTPRLEAAEPGRVVRLHGISAREMQVLSDERILNRYVRAVRERNIRVLYVRPFMQAEGGWQRSLDVLDALGARLEAAGFELGTAEPFAFWQPLGLLTALVAAGIWAGAILYGQALFPGLSRLVLGGGILGYLGSVALLAVSPLLAKQGLALVAAVVFPCLALECQWGGTHFRRAHSVLLVSLLGALFVVGTLSGTEFLVKMEEFRGVKLMHVLPIALMFFTVVRPVRDWLRREVPVRWLLAAGGVGLVGVLYVLRTGNFGIPVLEAEVQLREALENLLRVRPRTKELFLGHPALYLALRAQDPKRSWLLPLAVIGQLSLVNTFTHTHTFLWVSLLRTLYGWVFGYALGWLVWRIYHWGKRWLRSDSRFGVLRVR
ncbi:DUF5693 family protein [Candidatus Darwinibacter acetoxidans]